MQTEVEFQYNLTIFTRKEMQKYVKNENKFYKNNFKFDITTVNTSVLYTILVFVQKIIIIHFHNYALTYINFFLE